MKRKTMLSCISSIFLVLVLAILPTVVGSNDAVSAAERPSKWQSLYPHPGLSLAGTRGSNPSIYPPGIVLFGTTYAEWSAIWWQWALAIPADQNPLIDDTGQNCDIGQMGPVWFLAGTFSVTPVEGGVYGEATRSCTVPADKALLAPIINGECSTAEGNGTGDELRKCAKDLMDSVTLAEASVDGAPLQALNPPNSPYRVQSPLFLYYLPDDNIFGIPSQQSQAASDGYWLFVKPLPVGEHVIKFHGKAVFSDGSFFETDITYNLTVVAP